MKSSMRSALCRALERASKAEAIAEALSYTKNKWQERASKAEAELAEVKKALTQLYMATPDCCGGELGKACCLARKYIVVPSGEGIKAVV